MADLDGMDEEARAAYEAALEVIASTAVEGGTGINFVHSEFRELTHIPSEVADIKGLIILNLDFTKVADLTPIQVMTWLQSLWLNMTSVSDLYPIRYLTGLKSLSLLGTKVSDLSPIRGLTELQHLYLNQTNVFDLRPLVNLERLGEGSIGGLWFSETPAVQADYRLAKLDAIMNPKERAKETLAYLKTLPPWPEPLPWLENADSPPPQAPTPEPQRPDPPLTRTTAGPKTSAKHVKFLLSQPRLTEFTAKEVAGQIRWALKDVNRATNSLPEPLATIEEIADALDALGNTRLGPKNKQRVEDLQLRIAQLEALVEKLTAQLSDSEKARETAEALARSESFQGHFSPEMATEAAKSIGFFARTGFLGGMIYFLGPTGPTITALLSAIEALK